MAEQILLNMVPGGIPGCFHVSQSDDGRQLTALLMENEQAFIVPAGSTVKIVGKKPSGLGFQITGTFNGNVVSFVTETTMTNEPGTIPSEIRITDGSGTRIGSANVMLEVEKDPHPDNTTDGDAPELIDEITELVEAAQAAEKAAEDAQALAEAAQTAAEAAQGAAEAAQTAAERAQGKAETAQGKAEDAQTAAETAQGKAEDAKGLAEAAQRLAEAAQTAAETAQGKAEDAQGLAEAAQTAAETAQGKAEDAQGLAETAQTAAETAQGKAEDAQAAAERAQAAAEASAAAIAGMTVSSQTLAEGSSATVTKTVVGGVYNLDFGIPRGNTGNGIASAELNSDYTLTITFTDGTSYTTPSIRGAQGPQGPSGTAENLGLVLVDGVLCYNWVE